MVQTAHQLARTAQRLTVMITMLQSIRELLTIPVTESMKIAAEQPMRVMFRQTHCAAKVFAHLQAS
jgi:hypothetical protein